MPEPQRIEAEQILIDHGVGKSIQPMNEGWDKKKTLYKREKVWALFVQKRAEYKAKFTNPCTQTTDTVNANKAAQIEIDNQLFAKIRGVLPDIVLDSPADDQLVSRGQFSENLDAQLDNLTVIDYVFNNIGFKDCKPGDAPCPGAYFYLKSLQDDTDNGNGLSDFYNKIWTKTIPSKSVIEDARNRNDDGRDTFKLLDRISAAYNTSQE